MNTIPSDADSEQPSFEDLIDTQVLNNLKALREVQSPDEPDVLTTLINLFLSDVPNRIAALREAVVGQDLEQAERLAHSLKSSCASIGAHSMASLCALLENRSSQGLTEGSLNLLDRLVVHFEQAGRYLAAERMEDQ